VPKGSHLPPRCPCSAPPLAALGSRGPGRRDLQQEDGYQFSEPLLLNVLRYFPERPPRRGLEYARAITLSAALEAHDQRFRPFPSAANGATYEPAPALP